MRYKNLLILVFIFLFSCTGNNPSEKPNILLIIADDLGYADMSFLSESPEDVNTPFIDQIAEKGTYFSNAYATSPICSPSRAGLITGRYQQRWGNYWYGEGGLPSSELTISQMLKNAGYRTYKVGKTHLNGGPVEHPLDHGFDEFLGFIDHTWDYMRLSESDVKAYGEKNARQAHIGPLTHNRKEVSYENDYTTDIFTRKAVEIIESESDKPFYIHLSHNAVHHPTYVCHPDYLDDFNIDQFPFWDPEKEPYMEWHRKWGHLGKVDPNGRKRYLLQLKVMDDGIGKIINALKNTGKYDNTLIIFISDNGGTINTYSNNQPLNGYKYMFGEGGIRVPMLISWPGHLPENNQVTSLTSAMDIFPTLAEVSGQTIPGNLDGSGILPLLNKETDQAHQSLFFSDGRDSWVVRHGPWKLAHNIEWTHKSFKIIDGRCVRDSAYVYPGGTRLYNLEEDISEQVNLSDQYPEVVDSLQQLYRDWRFEMSDPSTSSGKVKNIVPAGESLPPSKKGYEMDVWSDGAHQNHYPRLAIDGNPETFWQTQSGNLAMPFPHFLIIDLKEPEMIRGIRYLPVSGQHQVKEFEIYTSNDKSEWGDQVYKGNFSAVDDWQKVMFKQPVTNRYLKFRIISAYGSEKIAEVSEIEIL